MVILSRTEKRIRIGSAAMRWTLRHRTLIVTELSQSSILQHEDIFFSGPMALLGNEKSTGSQQLLQPNMRGLRLLNDWVGCRRQEAEFSRSYSIVAVRVRSGAWSRWTRVTVAIYSLCYIPLDGCEGSGGAIAATGTWETINPTRCVTRTKECLNAITPVAL